MIDRSMIEIKCPKCGSEDICCYETDFDMSKGINWDFCDCRDCHTYFDIKYVAVEIEVRDQNKRL